MQETPRNERSYSSSPSPPPQARKRKVSSSKLDNKQSSDKPCSTKVKDRQRKSRRLGPHEISAGSGQNIHSESDTSSDSSNSSDENNHSLKHDNHCSDCPKAYQVKADCKHRFEFINDICFKKDLNLHQKEFVASRSTTY